LEVDPYDAADLALQRRAEGDHGHTEAERQIGGRDHQLTCLQRGLIPDALAGVVTAAEYFPPFELFAVLVLENPRRGQFAVARRLNQCSGERSVWRYVEAFPLLALQSFHTLHLQPAAVVIAHIDALKCRPLDQ